MTPRNRPYHDAHRILSYPVCIESEHYPRNAFTFNFGLILEADTEFSSYLPVVKKLATLFRTLEEQSQYLTRQINQPDPDLQAQDEGTDDEGELSTTQDPTTASRIYAVCEILLEDLNNYSETQIPLDDANTLSLKLFPTYPPPPPLYAWQVPLLTVTPETVLPRSSNAGPMDRNSRDGASRAAGGGGGGGGGGDITLNAILPYINGINSVKRISWLADADLKLVRKAIRHLLYYNCCLLLDIFSFSAIYAPTESISSFVEDEGMQLECARYVRLPIDPSFGKEGTGKIIATTRSDMTGQATATSRPTNAGGTSGDAFPSGGGSDGSLPVIINGVQLVHLYTSLQQGLPVKIWIGEQDPRLLEYLDIRRFITFGVIKGFLYRVHRYAIASSSIASKKKNKNRHGGGKSNKGNLTTTSSKTNISTSTQSAMNAAGPKTRTKSKNPKSKSLSRGISHPAEAEEDDLDDDEIDTNNQINKNQDVDEAEDDEDFENEDEKLATFLDGTHSFDEICTEMEISERELMARLKGWKGGSGGGGGGGSGGGDVAIICR